MHPAMVEASARLRVAELRGLRPAPRTSWPPWRRFSSVRRAIGWFLVNLGMRLALPQPEAVRTATG
jgi:hypothetical protein